jgi:hypothetical protein
MSPIVACAFSAAKTYLLNICLAALGGHTDNKVISLASFYFLKEREVGKSKAIPVTGRKGP